MNAKNTLFCITLILATVADVASADEPADSENVRKSTAVALNYCRAALHRIRRNPDKPVLLEEQTRILNNLDLNQIEDPEVITLYRSILDEIGQVEISDRERVVINEQFRRNVHRQLSTNFFVIGAQVMTGQLGNAVQAGANGWWDYRNTEIRRDADEWKVEKTEFTGLMNRSSTFLESVWRLAQKNKIPDRWLIRDQDLDHLGRVLTEQDPNQRLRMLNRMARFMECYPPYWYYVARTQQQLGQTEAALETYKRLAEIGTGHFRQDDMLATSMANMALLQESIGDPDAAMTAARVMDYSISNWESNLICAWVLGRHGKYDDAEELILCNLDEDQEPVQSRVALVSLYYHSDNTAKLARLLDDPQIAHSVPVPGLLLCAKALGTGRMPAAARAYLASTLSATARQSSSGHAVTLAAASSWKLQDAKPTLESGEERFRTVGYRPAQNGVQAQFVTPSQDAEAASEATPIRLTLSYPGTPEIYVTLAPEVKGADVRMQPSRFPGSAFYPRSPLTLNAAPSAVRYEIGSIELEGVRLSFDDDGANEARRVEDSTKEVLIEDGATRS